MDESRLSIRAVRQQRDWLVALQINRHGAILLAFAQREVIYPKDRRRSARRERQDVPEYVGGKGTARERLTALRAAYFRQGPSHT